MTKTELRLTAEKYGMEFIRENVTQEGVGVWCVSAELIPELDAVVDADKMPVVGTRSYTGDSYLYRIYCPKEWIDLWGWRSGARKKYTDCQRSDGDCSVCAKRKDGTDCHGEIITKLELCRRHAGLTQKELSDAAGVNERQLRRVELGESEAKNLTAENLLALADALGVDPHELI